MQVLTEQKSVPHVLPENAKAAQVWSAGGPGYERISRQIADAIEHTVDRLAPRRGERVLDVCTGTGWTARRVAQRGAQVTAVDFGADVLEAAKALDGGAGIEYWVADAESLPFPNGHFDAVVSTFGVMFCGRPERAASELARVTRPGGRVALATWASRGGVADMFALLGPYRPATSTPPPSPFAWGDTARLVELLGEHFDLGFEEATSYYREPDGTSAWEAFSLGYGPLVTLIGSLDEDRRTQLRGDFVAYHEGHRTGLGVLVPRPYVVTVGRRR